MKISIITMCILKIILHLFMVYTVQGNTIINTSSGKVEGKVVSSIVANEKYYSFLGIPYAEPPIGKLRFMPPVPHKGWENVLNTKKGRKACAQNNNPMRAIKQYGFYGDEDCLFLNVHTPKLPSDEDLNLPVIVYLHNEIFKLSRNISRDYSPDFIVNENVILVTVQHRLGPFGFLSFEDDLLPGNNGLRDIILALKWLKNNILNFGGDPQRIILMGSQGGAMLVDILLHSPKAKGLFNGIILQSGSSWNPLVFTSNAREKAIEFSKGLNQEATTSSFLIKRLNDLGTQEIAEAEHMAVHTDEARAIQRPVAAFGPVIEHEHPDAIITKVPGEEQIQIDLPVMIGYNSREGTEYVSTYLKKPQFLSFAERDFLLLLPIRVSYNFQLYESVYHQAINEIRDFYFDESYIKISKPGEYITYIGDILSIYSIDYTVRTYTNESSNMVYYYVFDFDGELNAEKKDLLDGAINTEGTWGAATGDELCYLFVCNRIRHKYRELLKDGDAEELKVLRNMVRMWTNFAKYGNPTPQGSDFIWKPSTRDNKECLVISDDLQIKTNVHNKYIEFWDEFLAKYKEKAVNGVVKDLKVEL